MTYLALPREDDEGARTTIAALPLADCLLALTLIAHGREGTPRLSALRDGLTVQEARAVAGLFGPPSPLGLLALGAAAAYPDDPARALAVFRDAPDTDTVAAALALAGARVPDAPASPGVYQSLIADKEWARAYVARYVVPPPADPKPLLAALADPAAARRKVADALVALVAAHLDALLPDLAARGADAAGRLREAYAAAPERFVSRYRPVSAGDAGAWTVFPSAFVRTGTATLLPNDGPLLVAVGAEEVPQKLAAEPVAPLVAEAGVYQDVYRLLADPVRWEIVRLLVAAPRYGQELAERLNLSVATVSHHLNALKRLDLVTLERIEHRLYYDLRADRLRALLAGASLGLLDDGGTQ